MERIQYKPLGTVVNIKGSSKKFMIIARALGIRVNAAGDTALFDYGGVMYPEGLTGHNVVYFQDEDIEEVFFLGWDDPTNKEVLERIWNKLKLSDIERADVKKLQESNLKENLRKSQM